MKIDELDMRAIMYHYVRPKNISFPFANILEPEKFIKNLDLFDAWSGFFTKDEYVRWLVEPEGLEEKLRTFRRIDKPDQSKVVLTFDDGFKDHYDYVFPVLKERNLWGIFYVPTSILERNTLLSVHRIHFLLAQYSAGILLHKAYDIAEPWMLNEERIVEFDREIYSDQTNSKPVYMFKRFLNYYLTEEYKVKVLDELASKYLIGEAALCESLYLTYDEIKEMSDAGMEMCAHSVSHPVLSNLSADQQLQEISNSVDCMKDFNTVRSFAYPYGGLNSFNQDTILALQQSGVDHTYMVGQQKEYKFMNNIPSYNKNCRFDINDEYRYKLKRLDCNNF